ncbi:signal peptidase II [Candidatus Fermentibacterales bacterium]|nr:signal peptidase II [Candidatus Fermentibacterales bacterium]
MLPDFRGAARKAGTLSALSVLVLDQLTKLLMSGLEPGRPVRVMGDLFRLSTRLNEGAAFSLSWGGPVVLTMVTAIAVAFLGFLILSGRIGDKASALALGAIAGGALGNLIDRLARGAVLDFIDIGAGAWRWPTFNVADIGITIGGLALVLAHLRSGRGSRPENA